MLAPCNDRCTKTKHKVFIDRYCKYQCSGWLVAIGLGKQPITFPPYAALALAVAADRSHTLCADQDAKLFYRLLELMYTAK